MPFARNIGQEFIRNTDSAFYQEESGFESGLFGITKHVTKTIFGSYHLVENCAKHGASPLESDFREISEFDGVRLNGFSRAALAFLEDYLTVTRGQTHSYALASVTNSFKNALIGIHRLEGADSFSATREYERLNVTVRFIIDSLDLIAEQANWSGRFRSREQSDRSVFDDFAELIGDVVCSVSSVGRPDWTCWEIQHNAVWGPIFSFSDSAALSVISHKVRRIIYDKIIEINSWPNFRAAKLIGYCLNVFGLSMDKNTNTKRGFYPLRILVLRWMVKNYRSLLSTHPAVAKACILGSISYDADNNRIVKTYASFGEKEPGQDFLQLA